ncbi:MAG TPA: TA system VapC family ribonuclease toxin [Humibacter sp.]|nr:TA system VapC family ribonuclease toxin [Humibacter sp.]
MVDVNVLVGAYRVDAPHHDELASWLESEVNGPAPLGITDSVLAGFVRIVTHPRVFTVPTPIDVAIAQATALRESSGTVVVQPGASVWGIFASLCSSGNAKGNLAADAMHAATAIEAGATWVTLDRDFARFSELVTESPLAE